MQTLLEDNRIFYVTVPNNCTDILQPLDLSVNKPSKDKLRKGFSAWYAEEVKKQMENGTQVDSVNVDMRMSVVKELSSRWIMSAYDYIRSSPDIIRNGFRKAGITSTIEDGIEAFQLQHSDDDPLESDDDADC